MELGVKLKCQIRTFNLSLVIVIFVVTVCIVACLCLVLVLCLSYLCYYFMRVPLVCKIVPVHYIVSALSFEYSLCIAGFLGGSVTNIIERA
jgi:hypothetical protein